MKLFKITGIIIGIAIFILLAIGSTDTGDTTTESKKSSDNVSIKSTQPNEVKETEKVQPAKTTAKKEQPKLVNYKIIHEINTQRFDGGKSYYLLIDKVDLTNDKFKNDIKEIIKKMVKEKGKKILIEFHDDKKSLDVNYKQYGDMTLGRPRTDEENKIQEQSYIAVYSGELETNIYLNTLMFFPNATTDTPNTGKYVEEIEFNP